MNLYKRKKMISPFRFINKFQIQFSYTQYISKLIIDYCHNQLPPSPSKKEKSFLSQNIKRLLKYEKCIIPKYISSAICNCIGWMGTSNNLSSNTRTFVFFFLSSYLNKSTETNSQVNESIPEPL